MGRADHRVCHLILCGAGGGGLVYELGSAARICAVCHLPDRSGDCGAGVGDEDGVVHDFRVHYDCEEYNIQCRRRFD